MILLLKLETIPASYVIVYQRVIILADSSFTWRLAGKLVLHLFQVLYLHPVLSGKLPSQKTPLGKIGVSQVY